MLSVVFALASSVSDVNKSTHFGRLRVKTRACAQLNYGPELNLDMCTVWAVIQLSLAKNEAERIILLLLLKINVCSHQSRPKNSSSIQAPGRKEFGIFARRAMVDQAREGLCYQ